MLLFIGRVHSQDQNFTTPNYDLIKKNIEDKSSSFYYPKLMERMISNDTTLTLIDYRHLYFGYVFNEGYSSFHKPKDEDQLNQFMKSHRIDAKDYDVVIKLCKNAILENPFDLKQINFLSYLYQLKKDEVNAKIISNRFERLLEAIMSSGDGKTCSTGFHVISVADEYVFLHVFDLEMTSQSLTSDQCDYMALEKGKYKVDGIYFSIGKILEDEMKLFKQK